MTDKGKEFTDIARDATDRANLADWRASACRSMNRSIVHLKQSYKDNQIAMGVIEMIDRQWSEFVEGRIARLEEISQENRSIAAKYAALLSEGAQNESE